MKTRIILFTVAASLSALAALGQPSIVSEPGDQLAIPGQRITMSVAAATTAPPLGYQWQRDGVPLNGKTNLSLVVTNVQVPDAGSYSMAVSDASGSITSRVATLTVIGPVPLNAKLSANIRLGDDPPQLPANLRAQAEPHIVRSFTDTNFLVAAFQEGRYQDQGAVTCGYSVSTDGGLTWSRALIPGLTTVNGGHFPRASDPVAALDLNDNIILNTITFSPPPPPTAVVVSISTNRGATFSAPIQVDELLSSGYADKEWIAINRFAGTPHANRVFVAYTRINAGADIVRVLSDDGGITWSPRKVITPTDSFGCQPMFLPDGSLAMIYARGSALQTIEMIYSKDGGETFEPPHLVADLKGRWYDDPIARDRSTFPTAVTDRQAGVIYLTYQAYAGPTTNRYPGILFTKSIDKGKTWSLPVAVNDTPARGSVFDPTIAVSPDGQHVTIAFYDKRHQITNSANNLVDLYLAESFDCGDTWEPNIRLSDVTSDLRLAPITPEGRMLGDYQGIVPALNFDAPGVAVWIDTRNGNPDPYIVRISRTRGTTFETWRKLRFSTDDLVNLALSGENADPDADGIPNLVEYAFGLEPTRVDVGPLKITHGAPGPGAAVTVSFERLAVLSDIQFSWQASTDLVDWTPISPALENIAPDRDPSMQRVEASFPAGSQMKFFRLGLTRLASPP